MKQKKTPDDLHINRIRCILAIIACTLLCVLVFLGVCIQLLDEPNPEIQEVGWKSYHLFTILSNMLMAASAAMCIPYAVDGLRWILSVIRRMCWSATRWFSRSSIGKSASGVGAV